MELFNFQIGWEVTAVLTIGGISLSLIFKSDLKELFKRLTRVTIGRRMALDFGAGVDQVPRQHPALDKILVLIPAADLSAAPLHDPVTTSMGQLDGVLHEVLKRRGVEAYGSDVLSRSVRLMQTENLVSAEQAKLINQLYGVGEIYRSNPGGKLWQKDARNFSMYVRSLIGWMEKFILPNITADEPEGKKMPPPRRSTQVGGYGVFPAPAPGRPAALLVAVGGPLKGRSFAVDRERYHIGAGAENDLRIADDGFVSRRHAYLRHQQDSLFLFDEGSRNGTFLNDRPLAEKGMTLAVGDHIRVGDSTFRVEAADREEVRATGEPPTAPATKPFVP